MMESGSHRVQPAHYQAIFLSPHLDDAVFSCAGLIARLANEGCRPLVVNIFSKASADFKSGSGVDDVRVAEEHAASDYLGFDVRFMGQLDAFFRCREYNSLSGLFMAAPAAYLRELEHVRSVLADALNGLSYDTVYAPLAVGWHVDHLLTHLAARAVVHPRKLRFYEDVPYTLLPHLPSYRLAELDPRTPPPDGGLLLHAHHAARVYADTQVMRSRLKAWVRPLARPVLTAWFYRLLRGARARTGAGLPLRPVLENVGPALDKKVYACELYRSQFPQFFASADECAALLRRYSHGICAEDGYWERYWAPA